MNQISTKFRKRESSILFTGQCVVAKMEENEAFPDPPEALDKLGKLLPEFQTALANALGRDKLLVAVKNNMKASVLELLEEMVDYVTVTCNGDRTLILSSGFDVDTESVNGNKQRPTIEKLEVELGLPGEAITRTRKVKNTIAFVHQYTTEPPGIHTKWYGEGSSLGSYTFQGLSSEKRYWFRVLAIGYYGLRGYSPVVTRVIQ